jgi:hypothetical protein
MDTGISFLIKLSPSPPPPIFPKIIAISNEIKSPPSPMIATISIWMKYDQSRSIFLPPSPDFFSLYSSKLNSSLKSYKGWNIVEKRGLHSMYYRGMRKKENMFIFFI